MPDVGPTPPRCLLGVFPHPDDESIAAALTLLHSAANGVATHVVTCTGGENGENLAGIELDLPMEEQRRVEMAAAADALQLTSHAWLGYRDSGMVGTSENEHPDAFTNADLDQAGARLASHIRRLQPQVVISDDAKGSYGHPDHVMAHRVTVRAIELAADPDADVDGDVHVVDLHVSHAIPRGGLLRLHDGLVERGLESPFGDPDDLGDFGTPDDQVVTVLQAPDHVPAKKVAMLAHRSQVGEDSFFFNFPDDLYLEFMGVEHYAVVSSARPLGQQELDAMATDLFAGVA